MDTLIFTLLYDFSHQSLLQILPTDIKKSLNVDSVIVEEEVTDSKKVLIWIKLSLNRHANMLNSQSEHEKQLGNVHIDIFQDISSAAENVCIEKTESVKKEGDNPNKKVKSPPLAILTQTFHTAPFVV